MSFIPIVYTPPTPAEQHAASVVAAINAATRAAVAALVKPWEELWESPDATPQEILTQLGPRGVMVLLAGSIAVSHLESIAAGLTQLGQPTAAVDLLGHAKYLTTAQDVIIHPDGTVTIAPVPDQQVE